MKFSRKIILLMMSVLFLLAACDKSEVNEGLPANTYPTPDWNAIPGELPQSLKGYELYSWQVGKDWLFTLVTGTNRSKSFEEITAAGSQVEDDGFIKITVSSVEDLETLLKHLPIGEEVTWSGIELSGEVAEGTLYFSYPPQAVMDEITQLADELGITLHTLQTP